MAESGQDPENVYEHPTAAEHPPAPPEDATDLDQAIAVLRARIDEEFRISERLDGKSRHAFTVAAGFFAVIQTVAFGSFGRSDLSSVEIAITIGLAAVAAALVGRVGLMLLQSEEPQSETDVDPDAIVKWANEASGDPAYLRVKLVGKLAKIAKSRHTNNESRASKFSEVLTWAFVSFAATSVELVVALAVRV